MITTQSSSEAPSIWASMTSTFVTSFGETVSRSNVSPPHFFSVSLAAHGDMENARAYVENFEQETGWRPAQVGFFSGALLYRQYGFLKRLMMKKIVRDKPGNLSLDTSRDHEYTEWVEVKRFAEDFLERLVPKDASKIKS